MDVKKQNSIAQELSWEGKALHTGEITKVTVCPAEAGFGIRLVREDVEGMNPFRADLRFVSATNRSTDIAYGGNEIRTIEHLLSALYAAKIDNALIKVTGPEVPILDGSAKLFYKELLANSATLEANQDNSWTPMEVITFQDPVSGASYTMIPGGEELTIETILEYDQERVGQKYAIYSDKDDYGSEISEARTFVFSNELLQLAEAGLIKGGDLDNAIVIPSEGMNREDLQKALDVLGRENADEIVQRIEDGFNLNHDNELARHKLLDLIGDLALIGARLKGRIIAKRPGHTGNIAFAKHLNTLYKKDLKLGGLPIYDPNATPVYTTEQVMGMLPHRYPFLMIDKVIELSTTRVVGVKNVTFNEGLFQGHFPNNPVFPGVLQMEALAQTGGILALSNVENPSDWNCYFLKMDNVKFKNMIRPGDTMILKMELLSPIRRGICHMQGTVYVGDKIASEGELTAQIFDRTK